MSTTSLAWMAIGSRVLHRRGIRAQLDRIPGFQCVGDVHSAAAARPLIEHARVVVLLDDSVGSCAEVVQLGAQIEHRGHVVALAGRERIELVDVALSAGAIGVADLDAPIEELAVIMRAAAGGTVVVAPALAMSAASVSQALRARQLTPREHQVLELLALGLRNREIAERLGRSHETVKTHVARILHKLDVHSRSAAVAWLHAHRAHNRPT